MSAGRVSGCKQHFAARLICATKMERLRNILNGPSTGPFFLLNASFAASVKVVDDACSQTPFLSNRRSSPSSAPNGSRAWDLRCLVREKLLRFLQQQRIPAEPEPFPVKEPPDPPENPDLPVREPDPEDPGQI